MIQICNSKLTIIGSDNGLSPDWHQVIIWTNAGILLIGTSGTNDNEILSKIHTFSLTKIHLNMSSAKWWQFCLRLNVISAPAMAASRHVPLPWVTGRYVQNGVDWISMQFMGLGYSCLDLDPLLENFGFLYLAGSHSNYTEIKEASQWRSSSCFDYHLTYISWFNGSDICFCKRSNLSNKEINEWYIGSP